VTVAKLAKPSWYVTSHRVELSLAIYLWVDAVSTGKCWNLRVQTA